jgi:hypothetical protein
VGAITVVDALTEVVVGDKFLGVIGLVLLTIKTKITELLK